MKRFLPLLLLLLAPFAQAEVYLTADNGTTSYYTPCLPLWSTDGVDAVTGITNATTNLRVSLIGDNEATWTDFTTSADIETIATIGTWSSPTANTDIRMDECETEGFYQYQFHNDHMSKTSVTELMVLITDNGTLFSDQVILIRQNPLTAADVSSQSVAAIASEYALASGTCSSGAVNYCIDAGLTAADDDVYLGQYFCGKSGTTDGQCSRISSFDEAADQVFFNPNFTASQGTNDYQIVPGLPSNSITADAFAAGAVDANALAADAIDEIWDEVVEDQGATYTGRCLLAILGAYAAGEFTTVGNTTTYQDTSGTETRIVGTVTASGRDTMSITCP